MSPRYAMTALFLGAVVTVIVGIAWQAGVIAVFPRPPGSDTSTPAGAAAVVAATPVAAQIAVVFGWFLADLASCGIALLLTGRRRPWMAWLAIAYPVLATVGDYGSLPQPLWMLIAGLAMAPLAVLLSQRLLRPPRI